MREPAGFAPAGPTTLPGPTAVPDGDLMPDGDLGELAGLAEPPPRLAAAISRTAARTAAQLCLDAAPFGAERYLGVGAGALAAAAGAAHAAPREAMSLVKAAGTPRLGHDVVAYHGVIRAVLPHLPATTKEAFVAASPLTGLLDAPARGQNRRCEALLDDLLASADGRRLATLELARPAASAAQQRWRADLLDRYRLTGTGLDFVLDVYTLALGVFGARHRAAVGQALAQLGRAGQFGQFGQLGQLGQLDQAGPEPAAATDPALVGAWWYALWAIRRAHPEAVRLRSGLRDLDAAMRLVERTRRARSVGNGS